MVSAGAEEVDRLRRKGEAQKKLALPCSDFTSEKEAGTLARKPALVLFGLGDNNLKLERSTAAFRFLCYK